MMVLGRGRRRDVYRGGVVSSLLRLTDEFDAWLDYNAWGGNYSRLALTV